MPTPYKEGFIPFSDLSSEDRLVCNFHVFEKTNFRVMVFSNEAGDGVVVGTLKGFHGAMIGGRLTLFPLVRTDEGKEICPMGFVFPLWPEFASFLETMSNPVMFWKLADLLNAHHGLRKLNKKVQQESRGC